MSCLDSDTFPYANGNLATVSAGRWTKMSSYADLVITANQFGGTAADTFSRITTWSGSQVNHWAECVQVTSPNTDDGGPALRLNTSNSGYFGHVSSPLFEVYKVVAGVITRLGTGGVPATNDVFYMGFETTDTLIMRQNGVMRMTFTSETSVASGQPGGYAFATAPRYKNWRAGDFAIHVRKELRPRPYAPGRAR